MVRCFIPLMLLVAAASASAQTRSRPPRPDRRWSSPSGVATVKRAPDQAFVTFTTESRAVEARRGAEAECPGDDAGAGRREEGRHSPPMPSAP